MRKKTQIASCSIPMVLLFCRIISGVFFVFFLISWLEFSSSCIWSSTSSNRNGFRILSAAHSAIKPLGKQRMIVRRNNCIFNIEPRMPARLQKRRISHIKPFKQKVNPIHQCIETLLLSNLLQSGSLWKRITPSFVSSRQKMWVKGINVQMCNKVTPPIWLLLLDLLPE